MQHNFYYGTFVSQRPKYYFYYRFFLHVIMAATIRTGPHSLSICLLRSRISTQFESLPAQLYEKQLPKININQKKIPPTKTKPTMYINKKIRST